MKSKVSNNLTILKPSGTLMFGNAMLSQLSHEMELLGVRQPVMITDAANKKRARKAASAIGSGINIIMKEPPATADFLLITGGPDIVKQYAEDIRPKARIILSDYELKNFDDQITEFTVVDSRFISRGEAAEQFLESFAAAVSDGMAAHPGGITVPPVFTYSCRTKVFVGDEALSELPGMISRSGMKRPLILTDKGIISAGIFDQLKTVLAEVEYEVFDDIPPDSSSDTVNDISLFYNEKKCYGIISMGGGSVLDTGKGVFLNVSLGVDNLIAMAGSNRIPQLDTPFVAIPTTSGTGSEMTKVAVISDAVKKRKILYVSPKLQPEYGILDSRLTASLPPHLTSITGMDALSHAIEAYTCLGKNPISDQMAWKAITLIRDSLIPVMTDPGNLSLRRNLAIASNMAGQAFSNSMVGMVHTIGHSVGAVCHAPHGSCMAVLMPAALEYNYPEICGLLTELLPALAGDAAAEAVPPEDRAHETIECIRRMNRELKVLTGGRHPTGLGDILGRDGIPLVKRTDFPLIAETSLGDASIVYNPIELRIPDIHRVLEESY